MGLFRSLLKRNRSLIVMCVITNPLCFLIFHKIMCLVPTSSSGLILTYNTAPQNLNELHFKLLHDPLVFVKPWFKGLVSGAVTKVEWNILKCSRWRKFATGLCCWMLTAVYLASALVEKWASEQNEVMYLTPSKNLESKCNYQEPTTYAEKYWEVRRSLLPFFAFPPSFAPPCLSPSFSSSAPTFLSFLANMSVDNVVC